MRRMLKMTISVVAKAVAFWLSNCWKTWCLVFIHIQAPSSHSASSLQHLWRRVLQGRAIQVQQWWMPPAAPSTWSKLGISTSRDSVSLPTTQRHTPARSVLQFSTITLFVHFTPPYRWGWKLNHQRYCDFRFHLELRQSAGELRRRGWRTLRELTR